ncbi:unnamed protein product [Bursaphelenchus xylophilus]|uniref:(pine wood nematode) hypothetical protein n=1 Tax=Bursaphelenchus xylophilus TaxID=6326 RepID=A0A1I7RQF7_BURXY|nr:unnamed protein product [Bursaphelenchus xylophilus]CAG9104499.1 unnamed protein product [Bursaphelenchus xylophilus]
MLTFQFGYRISDVLGSACGIIVNLMVLFVIRKTATKSTSAYGRMLIASAVYDTLYSLCEILQQHQLLLTNGTLIIVPRGMEKDVGHEWCPIFLFFHLCLSNMSCFMLPAQYFYRYRLLLDATKVNGYTLLRAIFVSAVAAIVSAGFGVVGESYSAKRGREYYMSQMPDYWLPEGRNTYLIAIDTADLASDLHFKTTGAFANISFIAAVFFIYKIVKYMNATSNIRSEKTKKMQQQFTKVIIIQGIATLLFAFIPLSIVSMGITSHSDWEMLGLLVIIPLSWLPTANGMLSLFVIQRHRYFLLDSICCRITIKVEPTKTSRTPASAFRNTTSSVLD